MGKRIEHKIIDGVELKLCGKCHEWKGLDCFNKDKSARNNLSCWCKNCKKQRAKQDRIDNPEKYKQWIKQYYNKPALYKIYAEQLCWCEEVRQDGEFLEVKCAYCGKWIRSANRQVKNRIMAINGKGAGNRKGRECRFYCSDNCKQVCPIFKKQKYPKGFKKATSREVVPLLRQLVLARDNYTCQKCGAISEEAQLHVHHEKSYTLNKIMANDPDNCLTLCKSCHKEIHKKYGCRYIDLKCPEGV